MLPLFIVEQLVEYWVERWLVEQWAEHWVERLVERWVEVDNLHLVLVDIQVWDSHTLVWKDNLLHQNHHHLRAERMEKRGWRDNLGKLALRGKHHWARQNYREKHMESRRHRPVLVGRMV